MPGCSSRFALIVLVLGLPATAVSAEPGAYVELTPMRSMRLAAAPSAPEIPGVTYPRNAPPDLVAIETHEVEPDNEDSAEIAAAPPFPSRPVEQPESASLQALETKSEPVQPASTLNLRVDLATQRLTVTEHGAVTSVWPISSGRAPYATTTGTFRPQWAARIWHSRQYDMAPMPHAVFFNGGIAFHATQATHLLGRPASHGCVRLSPQNARALYAMIHAHGFAHTEIIVTRAPQVAATDKRKTRPARISGPPSTNASPWPFF